MKAIVTMFPLGIGKPFKVVLVSDRFTGERFLNRHRMILRYVNGGTFHSVHALALHTCHSKRREGLQDTIFASPPCRGAGRHRGGFATTSAFQYVAAELCENVPRAVLFCQFERVVRSIQGLKL